MVGTVCSLVSLGFKLFKASSFFGRGDYDGDKSFWFKRGLRWHTCLIALSKFIFSCWLPTLNTCVWNQHLGGWSSEIPPWKKTVLQSSSIQEIRSLYVVLFGIHLRMLPNTMALSSSLFHPWIFFQEHLSL